MAAAGRGHHDPRLAARGQTRGNGVVGGPDYDYAVDEPERDQREAVGDGDAAGVIADRECCLLRHRGPVEHRDVVGAAVGVPDLGAVGRERAEPQVVAFGRSTRVDVGLLEVGGNGQEVGEHSADRVNAVECGRLGTGADRIRPGLAECQREQGKQCDVSQR